MSIKNFVGGRIIKTGISVFVTAFICHLLNWPAMFAVITAIVTIEPTASDSIRKAFVRFPASAIGAGFAVLFTFLFGDSPYSYALVSLFTIIICHKLKFHDGMLVATLTGVAMISTVNDHYTSSFFIRLGTTTTGLIVSSLVNIVVMPPNYLDSIKNKIFAIYKDAVTLLYKRICEIVDTHKDSNELRQEFQTVLKDIEKTETLFTYQKEEWKFHRFKRNEARKLYYEYKKFTILRQISNHLGNLIYLPTHHFSLDCEKGNYILSSMQSLKTSLCSETFSIDEINNEDIRKLTEWFSDQREENNNGGNNHHITPETAIMYELLSIFDLIDELKEVQKKEFRGYKDKVKINTSSSI
ncbi:aromatic acid exporter family protein [Fredinandcohnia sp. 179-A 10B2 NHS]|uniref:aromatic acid exporter family protein n=1 Tax=Fredinandcohnia sp. 179-A 10B2 NHS TaxID=3235176 RepID=UPI0039A3C1D0